MWAPCWPHELCYLGTFRWFQGIFKYMEGSWYTPALIPLLSPSPILYDWTFLFMFCCELDYFIQVYKYFSFYPMTVHLVTALYLFAPYSHILAFWLMLFVYNSTLNKALSHLILTWISNCVYYLVQSLPWSLSHKLLDIWLLFYSGIDVNLC